MKILLKQCLLGKNPSIRNKSCLHCSGQSSIGKVTIQESLGIVHNHFSIHEKTGKYVNLSELQTAYKNDKTNHQLKRKLKIFLGIGCAGILLGGVLIIWAAVTTVQHVADVGAKLNVPEKVQNLKTEALNLPALVKIGCWDKVQSLLDAQVWLEKPVSENIQSLKDACWDSGEKPTNQ